MIFLFLIVDLISLLLTLSANGVFNKKNERTEKTEQNEDSSSYWELMLPIIIEWFITFGFYINFQIRKKKLKSKIKKLIEERKNFFKCYNNQRAERILEILKLQGRHFKNAYFEKLLITILLVFIPFILKSVFFRKLTFQAILSVSATLFYGYDIILEFIKMVLKIRKQRIYNKELYEKKADISYNKINVADNNNNQDKNDMDNNLSLEDIDININNNYILTLYAAKHILFTKEK